MSKIKLVQLCMDVVSKNNLPIFELPLTLQNEITFIKNDLDKFKKNIQELTR